MFNVATRVPIGQLPLAQLRFEQANENEEQYWKIARCDWTENLTFDSVIPNTVAFWSHVTDVQTSLGDKSFKELATYALNCLTTPVSNAVVERTFSLPAAIKTKQQQDEIRVVECNNSNLFKASVRRELLHRIQDNQKNA